MKLRLLDTTLRDGDQAAGFAFSPQEKLRISLALADCGVDIIEAGFPSSSKIDYDACSLIAQELCSSSSAVSFMCRAIEEDIKKTARCFGKKKESVLHLSLPVSDRHIHNKLGKSRTEILSMAQSAVTIARDYCDVVEMGAEDATCADKDFLSEYLESVIFAGAKVVNIADTVGVSDPVSFFDLISFLRAKVGALQSGAASLSVHCHNDFGLATANTLSGIRAGAEQVEVSVLGLGERAGNASLEEIVANILFRPEYAKDFEIHVKPESLGELDRLVARICGTPLSPLRAVMGSNVRSHASGIHQQGLRSSSTLYSPIDASLFNAPAERIVLSHHSGKAGCISFIETYAGKKIAEKVSAETIEDILFHIKEGSLFGGVTEVLQFLEKKGTIFAPLLFLLSYEMRSEQKIFADCEYGVTAAFVYDGVFQNCSAMGESLGCVIESLFARLQIAPVKIVYWTVSSCEDKSHVFAEIKVGGVLYSFERVGQDSGFALLGCALDAVNSFVCVSSIS